MTHTSASWTSAAASSSASGTTASPAIPSPDLPTESAGEQLSKLFDQLSIAGRPTPSLDELSAHLGELAMHDGSSNQNQRRQSISSQLGNMGVGYSRGVDRRTPTIGEAVAYVDLVHGRCEPQLCEHFLSVLKQYKEEQISPEDVILSVLTLFTGHSDLVRGFNAFLPEGYRIEVPLDANDGMVQVIMPGGLLVWHWALGAEMSPRVAGG